MGPRIKVLSVMEADSITGPAKILLDFAQRARNPGPGLPGVDFSIVGYRRGNNPESVFLATARAAGLPVDVLHETRRFDPSIPSQLRRIVAARQPDIVQSHNTKSHLFMRLSGIPRNTPWVAFHHGFTWEDWRMKLYHRTTRWSLRGALQVVAVCRPFVDQVVERGVPLDRVVVRPNFVRPFEEPSTEAVEAVRRDLGFETNARCVLAVGRLSAEKAHIDLLEAFAEICPKTLEKLHLVIVGEGPERGNLERRTRELGLQGQVSFVGLKSDVRPYYRVADISVLPSHTEGSPNVLLEAMAAGCPQVATRVGGVPDTVVHEESALLVNAGDRAALAANMLRLLTDRELAQRLALKARQLAETQFSPGAYCEDMVRMYARIIGQRV